MTEPYIRLLLRRGTESELATASLETYELIYITDSKHLVLRDTGNNIRFYSKETIDAQFNITTGHSHDGTDSTRVSYTNLVNVPSEFIPATHGSSAHTGTIGTWADIDKTTSSIADITTKSHTALSDIGTNTHSAIDTFIGTTVPAYFNTSSGHDHDGSDSKKVTYTDLVSIPSTFAPSAHGSSAHTGTIGGEGQITFLATGGHTHNGTNSTAISYTNLTNVPSTFAPSSHGSSAHTGTVGTESQITFSSTDGHTHNGSNSTTISYNNLINIPSTFTPAMHGSEAHTDLSFTISGIAGETLVQYDIVFADSDVGKYKKSRSSGTIQESDAVGMVVQSGGIGNNSSGSIQLFGLVTNSNWSWVTGGALYVGTTYGSLTQSQPSSGFVKPIGFAVSATQILFFPQTGWSV